MSNLWPKFTRENPCPACRHFDWSCRSGERKFICMRVQSGHPSKDGGWFHEYNGSKPAYIPHRKSPPKINPAIATKFDDSNIESLAKELGVSVESLAALDAAWSQKDSAWVFPMKDGDGNVIGFRTRHENGQKKAIVGSKQGLFIPNANADIQNVVMICEGPTDTAAALTLGFYAIGRPSCNGGGDLLKSALQRMRIFKAVIVVDNDTIKSTGTRPGLDGALKLKKELGISCVFWMPPSPIKDIREFLKKGGTRQMIESDISRKLWGKK